MKSAKQFANNYFPNGFPELAEQWIDCIEQAQADAYAAGQKVAFNAAKQAINENLDAINNYPPYDATTHTIKACWAGALECVKELKIQTLPTESRTDDQA